VWSHARSDALKPIETLGIAQWAAFKDAMGHAMVVVLYLH